jgi:uncharacterized Zn finger protein
MDQLRKQGRNIQPVENVGRQIARTFWGKAWCEHMESLGDFKNRLPRGRTYVRNGSVCHLEIKKGRILAMVSGSSLYKVEVKISTLPKVRWDRIKRRCLGQIGSLIELLQGSLSAGVMEVVTNRKEGLFPSRSEIQLACDCPDWARLCKHVAAVLYGVGARLDAQPDLLFLLRGVQHDELIDARLDEAVASTTARSNRRRTVAADDLGNVFGIDLEEAAEAEPGSTRKPPARSRRSTPTKKAARTSQPTAKKKTKARRAVSAAKEKVSTKKVNTKKSAAKKSAAKKNVKPSGATTKSKPAVSKQAKRATRKQATPASPAKKPASRKSASA